MNKNYCNGLDNIQSNQEVAMSVRSQNHSQENELPI